MRSGKPTTFLTITHKASDEFTPDEAAKRLVHAWRVIRRRYSRLHPGEKIEFMAVFEKTKAGWPHLHIVARMKFLPQNTLSVWMSELADSPVCDIRRVTNDAMAAAYVAKYCGKDPTTFKGAKRYWASKLYRSKSPKPDWLKAFDNGYSTRTKSPIGAYCDRWSKIGWLIEVKRNWVVMVDPSGGGPITLRREVRH